MRTILSNRVRSGDLLLWQPQFQGDPCERTLFITAEVNDEFDEETWEDASLGFRYGQLSADFDRYTSGDTIQVALNPHQKSRDAFLARIDPPEYGIWDIRSIAPSPAIRVFGAFAETDVFVALFTRLRKDLGGKGSREWMAARENAIAKWDSLFPLNQRLLGENVNDFISEAAIPV